MCDNGYSCFNSNLFVGAADVWFISGRLKEIKAGSALLWQQKISTSLDVILKGGVAILSAEVAEKTAGMSS